MAKLGRAEGYAIRKIGMAAKPKDWQKIEKYHNKAYKDVADHYGHMQSHPAPEHYKEFLQSEKTLKSEKDPSSGIRRKMIHDIQMPNSDTKTRIMTKAYFPKIEGATRSWVKHPIHGWSTIATNSLYHAAGLGNNVEKVSVHEHNKVPLTVHTFSPNYRTIYSLISESGFHKNTPINRAVNPLQIQQIAAMDFLMGNNDRHGHNLMVSNHTNEEGYHDLLAIDHERNFQYFKQLNELRGFQNVRKSDKPHDYIDLSALHEARRASYENDQWDFYEWWTEAAPKIKNAFDLQIQYIKDPSIREHIKKNFNCRFNMLQKWATGGLDNNYQEIDFFSKNFPDVIPMVPKPRAAPETIKAIRDKLPKNNPEQAIRVLCEAAKRKNNASAQQKLYDLFRSILKETDSNKLVELYEKFSGDTDSRIGNQLVSYEVLHYIADIRDIKTIKALLNLDEYNRKLPVFWKSAFQNILGVKQ